jgi:phosphoglycolate phosphatase
MTAVFFDLDGTLTDPKPGITRSIQHALAGLGRTPPPMDELLWCIGPPLSETFARLLGDGGLVEEAIRLYRERFGVVGLFENTLYPEIPAAVAAVRAAGHRTFVVTSKPRVFAARIVDHFALAPFFDAVHGSELDGTRADKGDLIGHVLAAEGLDPAAVVMVGDREHDVIGARRCGVRCIGVSYGYGSEAELRAHGATLVAASPPEVVEMIQRLLGGPPAAAARRRA